MSQSVDTYFLVTEETPGPEMFQRQHAKTIVFVSIQSDDEISERPKPDNLQRNHESGPGPGAS